MGESSIDRALRIVKMNDDKKINAADEALSLTPIVTWKDRGEGFRACTAVRAFSSKRSQ